MSVSKWRRVGASAAFSAALLWQASSAAQVTTGLERLLADPAPVAGLRVGLIANASSVNSRLEHAAALFAAHPEIDLVALFAPEHGLHGLEHAGAHVADGADHVTNLPVFSLHGESKRPTSAMLAHIDALVFDVQDVGTRFYTYSSTLYEALLAAKAEGIRVIVLDRPNPLGGVRMEGPILQRKLRSFLGVDDIPLRHGLTVGELALYFNRAIAADLMVVAMVGWRRDMDFAATGLPWVMPSPNMPTTDTALVYPGMGLVEGTNLSEGRGTTRPFELIGAPFVDGVRLAAELNALELPGVRFRAAAFRPTFAKYVGEAVMGVQLHVSDPLAYDSVGTALHLLGIVRALHPDAFAIDRPEHFDRLTGDSAVRAGLLSGMPVGALLRSFEPDLALFAEARKGFLLYD